MQLVFGVTASTSARSGWRLSSLFSLHSKRGTSATHQRCFERIGRRSKIALYIPRNGLRVFWWASLPVVFACEKGLIGQKMSECHSGYRAFSRKVLETLPLIANSDDFPFDNQMLVQCHMWGFRIAEISCPTKYFPE